MAQFKWSLLLIIITMVLAIILPLVITKITYDKDDQPLVNLIGLQRSLEDSKADRESQGKEMKTLEDSTDKKIAEAENACRASSNRRDKNGCAILQYSMWSDSNIFVSSAIRFVPLHPA